jgi:hypothetical protein
MENTRPLLRHAIATLLWNELRDNDEWIKVADLLRGLKARGMYPPGATGDVSAAGLVRDTLGEMVRDGEVVGKVLRHGIPAIYGYRVSRGALRRAAVYSHELANR